MRTRYIFFIASLLWSTTVKTQANNILDLSFSDQPEIWASVIYARYKDEGTSQRWQANSFGIRTTVSMSFVFAYVDITREDVTYDFFAQYHPYKIREQLWRTEAGAGVTFGVPVAQSGFYLQGLLSSPFDIFHPTFELGVCFEKGRLNIGASNRFVILYSSTWNPCISVGFRLYKSKREFKVPVIFLTGIFLYRFCYDLC